MISTTITAARTSLDHMFFPMYDFNHGPHCIVCENKGRRTRSVVHPIAGRVSFCWDDSRLSLSLGATRLDTITESLRMLNEERSTCYMVVLPRKPFPIHQFFEVFVPNMTSNDTLVLIPYYHSGFYDLPYKNNMLKEGRKPWTKKVWMLHIIPKDGQEPDSSETKTLRDAFGQCIRKPTSIRQLQKVATTMFNKWEVELLSSQPILLDQRFVGYPC